MSESSPKTLDQLVWKWQLQNANAPGQLYDTRIGNCGPGWIPLLDTLCATLVSRGWDRRVHQIKEKLGGLRFYLVTPYEDEAYADPIWVAEAASFRTCEHCGAPGTLNRTRPRVKTLCDTCGALWNRHELP